jgi:gluconate 2-dehydrogenase gamma chain
MIPTDDEQAGTSRRSFLVSSGGWLTSAWIGAHWPAIAAAAHHAVEAAAGPMPARFDFFNAADAADVEAIAAQIVPSGATPGAREAHAAYFIDRAMATFFADWAHDFRPGLAEFQARFRASIPQAASFASAAPEVQIDYLRTVDRTAFFEAMRTLTLLGMFSSPKYGGNFQGIGWAMMGFKDQHVFTAPYGYYDHEYTGFVPYATDRQA